jgi:hypothetical protein
MSSIDTGGGVAIFDFYSHARMHLPFNEGYLRVVRVAFPDEPITLHADPEHLENLIPQVANLNLQFSPIARFKVPFGLSHHNPVGARLAAAACLKVVRRNLQEPRRLSVLLGVDAGLLAAVGKNWRVELGPMHMLLHGSLAANYVWRSRNPLIRLGDLRTVMKRSLRPGVRLIGLELGVPEAIIADFPIFTNSLGVLEHPVLATDWADGPGSGSGPLAIGFLGFGSIRKGFDVFAAAARDARNSAIAFDAVGHVDKDARIDTTAMRRQLAPHSLTRAEYLRGLRVLDLVCLPLDGRSYEFAGSGTVSDAVAALKPIIAFRNRTFQAIEDRYGPIGRLFDKATDMTQYLRTLNRDVFEHHRADWIVNLRRMRDARLPEVLGRTYWLQSGERM